MNAVKVMFSDSKYDYTTSVGAQSTEKSCREYFVGTWFDVGQYPAENLQRCSNIEFINNNEVIA